MQSKKNMVWGVASVAAILLSGCGGGGSSSNPSSNGGNTSTPHYIFTDLGTLGGTQPNAINNKGQIAGFIGSIGNINTRAFLHTGPGPITESDLLGTFPGVDAAANGYTYASALNNLGEVVGTAQTPSGSDTSVSGEVQASFVYDTQYHFLGGLPPSGYKYSYATGINDSGVSVGYTYDMNQNTAHGFRHNGTAPITASEDIGTFGGYTNIIPNAINNSNLIVGTAENSSSSSLSGSVGIATPAHAFAYDTSFHDLGVFVGGFGSVATGVNSSGQITGNANIGNTWHAFRHSGLGPLTSADDLGVPTNFTSSYAFAINALGTVVGWIDGPQASHAFVCPAKGALLDLTSPNVVSNLPSGFNLQIATGINDQGQIVGYGYTSTSQFATAHGWLLTPAP